MKRKYFKVFLVVFLTLTSLFSYSQEKRTPIYYLNSKKVEVKNLFFNSKGVDSIRVERKTENGEIYIYTKNKNPQYLSLEDVLKKYTDENISNGTVLIRIDGKIVDDITNIRIDDTYFVYVETKKLSEAQYLSDKFRELVIVDITLETEERKPRIIIRGNNEILPTEMTDLMKK